MKDIQYKHQLQYTVLLQESAQALQAVVPDQETPITKTRHCQHFTSWQASVIAMRNMTEKIKGKEDCETAIQTFQHNPLFSLSNFIISSFTLDKISTQET